MTRISTVCRSHCQASWRFGFQLLNKGSNFSGDYQLNISALVYLAAVKSGRLRESLDSRGALPSHPSIRTFQDHVVSYLCVLSRDYSVLDSTCQLLCLGCLGLCRGGLDSLDVDGMTVESCDTIRVEAFKFTTEHDRTKIICFTWDPIQKQMSIGYYNGTLLCINHYGHKDVERGLRGRSGVSERETISEGWRAHV